MTSKLDTADGLPPPPNLLEEPELRVQLGDLMTANFVTGLVYVAAKLGVPDLLAHGALTSEQVAERTGANPRAMAAILRVLGAVDVLEVDGGGRYALRPLGHALRSNPGWRSQALLLGEEYFRASAELLHTAMTGKPAFDRALGSSFYEYFGRNPEAAARFNEVMTLSASIRYADVAAAYDFSAVRTLVDVGAGHGGLAAIIMRAWPQMRTVLFDRPEVIAGARPFMEARELAARCEFTAGDFFAEVPAGGDHYLLSSVIVNWDDDRAAAILRNCRRAMDAGAKLLVIEHALMPGASPSRGTAVIAFAGFAIQGAIVRTEAEYRALLGGTGFELAGMRALAFEPYALIQARAV
jgi:trans-aconitate methyltransferase